MLLEIPNESLVYVMVPVSATDDTGAVADPTADSVEMAFSASENLPASPTWNSATWETTTDARGRTRYFARCLVGPGNVVLAEGTWWPFVRVHDVPETPVLRAQMPILIT